MSRYRVEFLNDEEFESLPGRNMEEKIGVAYPNLGVAYARKTGISTLDAFTAIHEMEHLNGNDLDEHFDSENECYYKGFGDVIKTVAPIALGFLAPVLAPALGGGLSAIGGAVGKGLGAISPALGGAAQSVGGAIGGAGKAIGGALGMGGGGSSAADQSLLEASRQPASLAGRLRSPLSPAGSAGAGPNFAAMGASSGIGSSLGEGAKQVGSSFAQNAAGSLFDGGSRLDAFSSPEFSSEPSISISGPNVVAGASGSGSQGGPGGAPGSIGGGSVSKIKKYLSDRDESGGNQGLGIGGYF